MTEGTPDGRTFDNRAGCAARLERDNQELRTRLQRAEERLQEIERFGHNEGHGRGYTCANMAQTALDDLQGESHD